MKYNLCIRDHNLKGHLDIEKEVQTRRDGLFTFTIRVNNGNIVDLNVTEYVNAQRKYGIITGYIVEKLVIAYGDSERSASDSVRTNYLHPTTAGRKSADGNLEHSEEQA